MSKNSQMPEYLYYKVLKIVTAYFYLEYIIQLLFHTN